MLPWLLAIFLAIALGGWWSARREVSRMEQEIRLYQAFLGGIMAVDPDTIDDRDRNTYNTHRRKQ